MQGAEGDVPVKIISYDICVSLNSRPHFKT